MSINPAPRSQPRHETIRRKPRAHARSGYPENSGADIRALTRAPEKAVKGDLADIDQIRAAPKDVSTLFLLALGGPDELTQAMQTPSATSA